MCALLSEVHPPPLWACPLQACAVLYARNLESLHGSPHTLSDLINYHTYCSSSMIVSNYGTSLYVFWNLPVSLLSFAFLSPPHGTCPHLTIICLYACVNSIHQDLNPWEHFSPLTSVFPVSVPLQFLVNSSSVKEETLN